MFPDTLLVQIWPKLTTKNTDHLSSGGRSKSHILVGKSFRRGFSCKKDTCIGRKYMRLYSDNVSQLSQDQSEAAYSRVFMLDVRGCDAWLVTLKTAVSVIVCFDLLLKLLFAAAADL